MSFELNALLVVSFAGAVVALLRWGAQSRQFGLVIFEVVALAVMGLVLHYIFGFPFSSSSTVAKGVQDDWIVAVALYAFMVAGMLAHYLYRRFERPRHRRLKWDWGLFLGPIFTSPIVFVPLLATFQEGGMDLAKLTAPRAMIFLVAFQNGFFWKEFFDRKQIELKAEK